MALVLLDTSSLIYRSFYSLSPDRFVRSDGKSTNAVYGVAVMLIRLVRTFRQSHPNVSIVACMDSPTCCRTRKAIQASYKTNRPSAPDQLRHQFGWVRQLLAAMDIYTCEMDGHEADDIIASYSTRYAPSFDEVIVVSPDKDMYQLVTDRVKIYNPRKKAIEGVDEVASQFGLEPGRFPLFQALVGDKVDNIPGVKGIGPKTAKSVLDECNGDIQKMFAPDFSHKKRDTLVQHKDLIERNVQMVSLNRALSVTTPPNTFCLKQLKHPRFAAFLDVMEIQSKALRQYACK